MIYLAIGMSSDGFFAFTKSIKCREDASKPWARNAIITDNEVYATSIITRTKKRLPDIDPAEVGMVRMLGMYEITPPEQVVFLKMGMSYRNINEYTFLKAYGKSKAEPPSDIDEDMERAGHGIEWIVHKLYNLEYAILRNRAPDKTL